MGTSSVHAVERGDGAGHPAAFWYGDRGRKRSLAGGCAVRRAGIGIDDQLLIVLTVE